MVIHGYLKLNFLLDCSSRNEQCKEITVQQYLHNNNNSVLKLGRHLCTGFTVVLQ